MFWQIFLDNIRTRFIKRENPWFKKRHELCYSNWYHKMYEGGEQ